MANFRESSIAHWSSSNNCVEHINAGSLQRIADATELMATSYQSLIEERDRYKRYYEERKKNMASMERRIAALRGVITKLRKAKP
jgi:hypothetical protein